LAGRRARVVGAHHTIRSNGSAVGFCAVRIKNRAFLPIPFSNGVHLRREDATGAFP